MEKKTLRASFFSYVLCKQLKLLAESLHISGWSWGCNPGPGPDDMESLDDRSIGYGSRESGRVPDNDELFCGRKTEGALFSSRQR